MEEEKYYQFDCGCIALVKKAPDGDLYHYIPIIKKCTKLWKAIDISPQEKSTLLANFCVPISKMEVAIIKMKDGSAL